MVSGLDFPLNQPIGKFLDPERWGSHLSQAGTPQKNNGCFKICFKWMLQYEHVVQIHVST